MRHCWYYIMWYYIIIYINIYYIIVYYITCWGIASLTLDLLRAQYPTFSSKSFSDRIPGFPPMNLRLPGVDQIGKEDEPQLKLRLLDSRSRGSCSPEVPLGVFPSSLVTQYPKLHRACPSFPLWVLKCGGCKVITAPNCKEFPTPWFE